MPRDGIFGAVARRTDLDAALLDVARHEGAKVHEGHAVTGVRPARALDAVIASRGLILDELAARAQLTSTNPDPQLASLNAAMLAARRRFANLMLRCLDGVDPVPTRLLEEARQQKEDAERALAARSVAAREEAQRAQIGLDDVRRAMPPSSALVSFVRYDRTSVVNQPPGRTVTRTAAVKVR